MATAGPNVANYILRRRFSCLTNDNGKPFEPPPSSDYDSTIILNNSNDRISFFNTFYPDRFIFKKIKMKHRF